MIYPQNLQERLTKRFLRYAAVTSQSCARNTEVPSTPGQWDMVNLLKEECASLGVQNLEISEHCVLTGYLPSNLPADHHKVPTVGWVAHVDTVDVCLSPEIHPQVIKNYQGGDICLNAEKEIFLTVAEHPEIERYVGSDIIVSDGTSVLGADDKSAISNIMTALEVLKEQPEILHGDIYIAFVPDEEIGLKGSKVMDYSKFPVDFAYTIDCCELGEVVYRTFNGGSAKLHIKGITAHPMSSKNVLVNPTLVAVDFINRLDRMETPEHTEGEEGFIWVESMTANVSEATVNLKIRDHNKALYEAKKVYLQAAVEYVRAKNPRAVIDYTFTDVYGNIADSLRDDNKMAIDLIFQGMKELDIVPKDIAMRGSTDGSVISTHGILAPNYFTGAHNFHSKFEFMPMVAIEKSCQLTLKLIELISK